MNTLPTRASVAQFLLFTTIVFLAVAAYEAWIVHTMIVSVLIALMAIAAVYACIHMHRSYAA
jgi:hypothetical protein